MQEFEKGGSWGLKRLAIYARASLRGSGGNSNSLEF